MHLSGTEFNDMFVLDTVRIEWTELTSMIDGKAPLGRRFHGFTEFGDMLYIFGGYNINLGESRRPTYYLLSHLLQVALAF
jgi:hypothetical protein